MKVAPNTHPALVLPFILVLLAGTELLLGPRLWARPHTVRQVDTFHPLPAGPPLDARLMGRTIFRDANTEELIRATASLRPPAEPREQWRLVLTKSRYRLDLFDGPTLVKVFPVAFGGQPMGDKEVMGDQRTPEGLYQLVPHHSSPNFGLSFYLLYPDSEDADRGYLSGLIDRQDWRDIQLALEDEDLPPHATRLGGLILVHGTKNRSRRQLTTHNWTLGCIAMENDHLLELLALFSPADRPGITIRP